MPHISRIYPRDEELGKRDDNYRPSKSSAWNLRSAGRWRRKRLVIAIAALVLFYLFVRRSPGGLSDIDERIRKPSRGGHPVDEPSYGHNSPGYLPVPQAPTGAPPRSKEEDGVADAGKEHYFSGPIKFYRLGSTLRTLTRTLGHRPTNRNVLFAASKLSSVASLMPLACEMARMDRNYVHVILMGREAIPIEEVLEINGVDLETCKAFFHDARADYSEYSSDVRAEVAVAGAMKHVMDYMHPQLVITDDSAVEDAFFVKGMRGKMNEVDRPIIEIPAGKYEDFLWMTRLDVGSLSSWHKPNVEVLIHVAPDASGSLIRLLKSLVEADYAGLRPPRLTIELPSNIEPFAQDFIRELVWPPRSDSPAPHASALNLHHRISSKKHGTEDNAVRFLESFYPADPANSHVLILSPQTELSPLYYQYVLYHILEYHYSSYDLPENKRVVGFSLNTPSTYLNGSGPFELPLVTSMKDKKYTTLDPIISERPAPFLWQAPSTDATLIYGEKWVEIHDYLTNRLSALKAVKTKVKKRAKLVSETQPGWTEFMLELIRARGWSTLFPARSDAGRWATVHNELYQLPEEFSMTKHKENTQEESEFSSMIDEPFLSGGETPHALSVKEAAPLKHSQPLHALLPFGGDLPELANLPLLAYSGEAIDSDESETLSQKYKALLRAETGGCDAVEAAKPRIGRDQKTNDLFCLVDQEPEYEDPEWAEHAANVIVGELPLADKQADVTKAVEDVAEATKPVRAPAVTAKPVPVVETLPEKQP